MKITASLIAHFSLRARSMTMSNEASCGPLLIASFIAAIRCEEDDIYMDSFSSGYLRVFRLRVR